MSSICSIPSDSPKPGKSGATASWSSARSSSNARPAASPSAEPVQVLGELFGDRLGGAHDRVVPLLDLVPGLEVEHERPDPLEHALERAQRRVARRLDVDAAQQAAHEVPEMLLVLTARLLV